METNQEKWDLKKFQGTADMVTLNLIEKKADEISQWLQDAVGDLAYTCDPLDGEWRKRVKRAKKDGVQDLTGWLADEYYNDPDTLQDLAGDRIFDAATQLTRNTKERGNPVSTEEHNLHFIAIAEKMKEHAHPALVKALDKLIERRS